MKRSYKTIGGSISSNVKGDALSIEVEMSLELMERSREVVEASAETVAGPRAPGVRRKSGPVRHGKESGSLRFGVKKVKVEKPRLREENQEVPVPLYERLRRDPALADRVCKASVNDLSTRRVEPVLESVWSAPGFSVQMKLLTLTWFRLLGGSHEEIEV